MWRVNDFRVILGNAEHDFMMMFCVPIFDGELKKVGNGVKIK